MTNYSDDEFDDDGYSILNSYPPIAFSTDHNEDFSNNNYHTNYDNNLDDKYSYDEYYDEDEYDDGYISVNSYNSYTHYQNLDYSSVDCIYYGCDRYHPEYDYYNFVSHWIRNHSKHSRIMSRSERDTQIELAYESKFKLFDAESSNLNKKSKHRSNAIDKSFKNSHKQKRHKQTCYKRNCHDSERVTSRKSKSYRHGSTSFRRDLQKEF